LLKKLLGIIRAPFLLLVPACLAPAYAVAWREMGTVDPVLATLVLVAGLASHIGVNALNEYQDFRSGLDFATTRTPFSGGSGTLVADTNFAPVALFVAFLGILVTFTIGLYFVWQIGPQVIVPGLLGLAVIAGYTKWINNFPLLCLFAPGIGFGLLLVNLGTLVLLGSVPVAALWVSIPVTLLVSNLLLVNQLPDVEADRRVGRNHLAIAWGTAWAGRVSVVLLAGVYLSIVLGWLVGALPAPTLLAWLTIPLAAVVGVRVLAFDPLQPRRLLPGMGANVALTLLTPALMAVGLVW
jgi:1,4-dihydroxy-2-naphthoate octaprenyltransferase